MKLFSRRDGLSRPKARRLAASVAALGLALTVVPLAAGVASTSNADKEIAGGCGGRLTANSQSSTDDGTGAIAGSVSVTGVAAPKYTSIGVWLDGQEYSCVTVEQDGSYYIPNLSAGHHSLMAWAPGLYSRGFKDVELTDGGFVYDVDFELTPIPPVPDELSLTSGGDPVTHPEDGYGAMFAFFTEPLGLSLANQCPGGSATWQLDFWGEDLLQGTLSEGPTGTYSGLIPQAYPRHGYAMLTIDIVCPSGSTTTVQADLYFDPSGVVVDQYGSPVAGAVAELYYSYCEGCGWDLVPEYQAGVYGNKIDAATPNNPQTTAADGRFGWMVTPGIYRVEVTAANSSYRVVTPALTVEPVRTGLVITLPLDHAQPPVGTLSFTSVDPGQVLDLSGLSWPEAAIANPDDPIEYPTASVIIDEVTWTAGGQTLGTESTLTVPAAVAGQTVGVTVTAHRRVVGHRNGIAPNLPDGAFQTFDFPAFSQSFGPWPVSGEPPAPTPIPTVTVTETVTETVTPPPVTETVTATVTAPPVTLPAQTVTAPAATVTVTQPGTQPTVGQRSLTKTPKPSISGKAKVGKTLTAKAGTWQTGVTKAYQWFANGKAIKGATKAKLKLTKKLSGKRITVKVTGSLSGYVSKTV
ncbi:MAG: carboxypeptidase-like regulatory domain-containing protein, partial [Bifidobacteriaceae bacterium]|nr:carboxypeptidase-like regulatory domain-containing protein [Bifidobacteriaceae bacterium]